MAIAISLVFTTYNTCTYAADTNQKSIAKISKNEPKNWYDNLIFKETSFIFEFIRTAGYAYEKGADIGECIDTAKRIKDGNDLSWYKEWSKTADRLYGFAQKMQKNNNSVSAKEAYLRASNYYRAAGFYMDYKPNFPKAMSSWKKSKESFLKAIAYMPNVTAIDIPYENTTLPGYFIKT